MHRSGSQFPSESDGRRRAQEASRLCSLQPGVEQWDELADVRLTEHDLQDESLLQELREEAGWESDEDNSAPTLAELRQKEHDLKRKAVQLKRDGDKDGALQALKEAKGVAKNITEACDAAESRTQRKTKRSDGRGATAADDSDDLILERLARAIGSAGVDVHVDADADADADALGAGDADSEVTEACARIERLIGEYTAAALGAKR